VLVKEEEEQLAAQTPEAETSNPDHDHDSQPGEKVAKKGLHFPLRNGHKHS
jgi:hypothetical protein